MDTLDPSVPVVSPALLASRIGTPDAPLLLDVRRAARFDTSPGMLAGARRCTPEDVARLAAVGPPATVVVYCVYGHAVSHDAAAQLRAAGWDAAMLAGGFEGGEDGVDTPEHITTWRAARLPTMRKRPDLGVTGLAVSSWITRERPKIDRIACPWLLRRFIDCDARIIYAPAAQVLDEARRLGAVAFDTPGAPISHEGESCSFDALLKAFELEDPALDLLARIVRGADTDQLDLARESAGLLAFSLGLSARHARDDHAMLEAALPLYDALFAWCRMKVQDRAESHSWNPVPADTGAVQ